MKIAAVTAMIVLAVTAERGLADSHGNQPSERAAIKHAESVVAGMFTGHSERRVRELPNTLDSNGRLVTARIEVTAHELAVVEHLDGVATPSKIELHIPGATPMPAAGRRVVLGVRAQGASPADGYELVYGHALDATTDDQLAALRTWVQEVRAPEPLRPEAIAEAIGQAAGPPAEVPAVAGPPGPDDPNGDRPLAPTGPALDAPRSVEPLGDPSHPPEPGSELESEQPTIEGGTPARSWSPPARMKRDTAAPPSTPRPTRRWPYAVIAALLLVIASAWWVRSRHVGVHR